MNFLKRLLGTKKIKNVTESIKDFGNDIDGKMDNVKDKISETSKKAADKIEYMLDGKISFDTFLKTELKIGEIISAEKIEKSKKLLKLSVSFNENEERQIVSGIAEFYTPEDITGKQALFVTNLEPRKIFGLESDGMILGVKDKGGKFSIISPEKDSWPGTQAG